MLLALAYTPMLSASVYPKLRSCCQCVQQTLWLHPYPGSADYGPLLKKGVCMYPRPCPMQRYADEYNLAVLLTNQVLDDFGEGTAANKVRIH